ncbi:MAG: Ig-like domain-containing protein [bacterium]|nr:Ig-like domain-containing protein [bacterium]MCS7308735.1 Ig-like domain-containing protein [Armatimonadota bacterium]
MKTLLWIVAFVLATYPPRLTVVPQEGSVLSDIVEVRVTSNEPLRRVEFLLDGQVVGSDTSTPYTWTWDTLSVSDGEHTLTIRATDWNNRVASTDVRYRVDNQLSRGGEFHLQQAQQHLSAQSWEEAVKAARRAVHLLPEDGRAHHLLAQAWLGVSQWTRALESAQRAAQLLPSAETYLTLAEAHLRVAFAQTVDQEKRFGALQEGVQAALRAGEQRLAQAKTPLERATALAQLGKLEEAATAYPQGGSRAEAYLSAARCYLLAGQWQDAERMCNLAEQRGADKTVVTVYRALALALRGRLAEARARLEPLKETEATRDLLALARADLALRERKPAEALRALQPLRRGETTSEAVETLLAEAVAQARDFPRAEEHFRNALLRNPLSWHALTQKGYETLAVGSLATASRYFELAARIRPDDAWVLCGQALCSTDKRQAVALAQRASQRAPSDAWVLAVLSWAQWRAGQLDEALRTIERARRLDRENVDLASPPDARRAAQLARLLGRRVQLPE